MQITIWCQNIDSDLLAALFIKHIHNAGFIVKEEFRNYEEKDEFIKAAIEAGYLREKKPYEGRDAIKVSNQKIAYGSSKLIESHEKISLYCRKNTKKAFSKFNKLFTLLTNDINMNVREICFSMGSMEDYPYFTFKSFGHKASIVMIDVATGIEVTHEDDNYWLELSPRLHFVSYTLLEESNVLALDWAKHIKAKVDVCSYGIVFDCGWSALGVNLKYAS